MATEAQEKCASAGLTLGRDYFAYKKASPIIWPASNLRGQVNTDAIKVPHSELAMAVGAAGKDIIAFSLVGENGAILVFDDGKGGCEFTFGLEQELIGKPLRDKANEIWQKVSVV